MYKNNQKNPKNKIFGPLVINIFASVDFAQPVLQ